MVRQLLFLLFISHFCYSQNTDSLWKVYNDKTQADTCRINALQTIAMILVSNKPDTTIILAQEVLKMAANLLGRASKIFSANALKWIAYAMPNVFKLH